MNDEGVFPRSWGGRWLREPEMLTKSLDASPFQSFFLFPVSECPNQPHGHAGVIGSRTIANGYYILNPVICNKQVDLFVQLSQFFDGLKYLQLSGEGLNFDDSFYLPRKQLMIHYHSTTMLAFRSMDGTRGQVRAHLPSILHRFLV